jgi:hypothetical protein
MRKLGLHLYDLEKIEVIVYFKLVFLQKSNLSR